MWFALGLCVIYSNDSHALGLLFGFEAGLF